MPPVVSPKARADIASVWDDMVGCAEVRPRYRRYGVERHVVFYRISYGTVDVVRVLHGRMDVPRHL